MNGNETIIDSGSVAKKKPSLLYLILAVLCAVFLWFYVAGVDTDMAEKKFTYIPIALENSDKLLSDKGFSVLSGHGATADITVSGRKADISKLKASDIVCWVDLDGVSAAGDTKLTVKYELPDGMSVVSCYPQTVTVYADESATVPVPVRINVISMTKPGDIEISAPVLSQTTVNVTGPAKLLETVKNATVSLDLGDVTNSFDILGTVMLTDSDGNKVESPYIKCAVNQITVSYKVYKTKSVPLKVDFLSGYLGEDDVNVKITPATVKLKGDPDVIDGLEFVDLKTFDESFLSAPVSNTALSYDSLVLPEGVQLNDPDVYKSGFDVELRLLNSSAEITVPLSGENVTVIAPAGLDYSFDREALNLTFRGRADVLSALDPADIKLRIDLSSFNTEGIKSAVPVKVEFQSSSEAYVLGEYFVTANLTLQGNLKKLGVMY